MPEGASIINLTSIEAHRAAPGHAVYTAMKAAVASFTKTLAVELARRKVRVNAIAADRTESEGILSALPDDLTATGWGDDSVSHWSNQVTIPMGRTGCDADIGGCALFLASDLSRYVTGSTLHPDGGALAASGWMNWPGTGFDISLPADVARRLFDEQELP
jgi:3-oxoacyl-[acyl-carrier protein] reductase